MTGKTVTSYSLPYSEVSRNATDIISNQPGEHVYTYTPMQVATAVTLMVGIYQVMLYKYFVFH